MSILSVLSDFASELFLLPEGVVAIFSPTYRNRLREKGRGFLISALLFGAAFVVGAIAISVILLISFFQASPNG